MNERRGELDFHPFAETEIAYRLVQQRLELEQLHQVGQRTAVVFLG